MTDQSYFNADKDKEECQHFNCQEQLFEIEDSFPHFNVKQFFEFFLYHMLWTFFFGPFTFLVISIFQRNFHVCNNMSFIPRFDNLVSYFLGLVQYSAWVFLLSIFVFKWSDFILDDVITIIIFLLQRCITIATRYAYLSEEKVLLYKQVSLPYKYLQKDFYLQDWRFQKPEFVQKEIYSVIKRHEIDTSYFRIEFFIGLDKETRENIAEIQKNNQEFLQRKQIICEVDQQLNQNNSKELYEGFSIFQFMLEKFNVDNTSYFSEKSMLFCSLIKPVMGAIIYFVFLKVQNVQSFSILVQTTMLGYIAFLGIPFWFFILGGLHEMKRKVYLLRQCNFLISPRKPQQYKNVKKLLPTSRYNDRLNLKSWQILRDLCMDYGKKYWSRTQVNLMFAFIYSLYPLGMLIYYFINSQKNLFGSFNVNYMFIYIMSCTVFLQVILFIFLFQAAQINSYFEEHSNVLETNRSILGQLVNLLDYYISGKIKLRNYIYRKELDLLKTEHGEDVETLNQVLGQNIEFIEDTQRHLKSNEIMNPFQFCGIDVTFLKIQTLFSLLAALTGALSEYMLNSLE